MPDTTPFAGQLTGPDSEVERASNWRGRRSIIVAAILAMIAVICYALSRPGGPDFWLNGWKYREIVAVVRQRKPENPDIPRGSKWVLKNTSVLGYYVEESRDDGGFLEVVIHVSDRGNAGQFGYIYSDRFSFSRNMPNWDIMPLYAHWWTFRDKTWGR